MQKKTLVLGASLKEDRYSFKAINKLKENSIPVVAFGLRNGKVAAITIDTEMIPYENIDTVTLYLNPKRQEEYYNYIIGLQPKRVIFNPGTENTDFVKLLEENNIPCDFDIFVLDVEGYEEEVLKGFSLDFYKPKMVIIEIPDTHPDFIHNKDFLDKCKRIRNILNKNYKLIFNDIVDNVYIRLDMKIPVIST